MLNPAGVVVAAIPGDTEKETLKNIRNHIPKYVYELNNASLLVTSDAKFPLRTTILTCILLLSHEHTQLNKYQPFNYSKQ